MKQEIKFFCGKRLDEVETQVNDFIDNLRRGEGCVENIEMQADSGHVILMVQYLRNRDYDDD